jgi:hypothetical protein
MELEGDLRLGKVMAMGENPFIRCLPAKNGHQRIRRMRNNVMLLWLQEIERKLSRGDRSELDSHEVPTMAVYGGKTMILPIVMWKGKTTDGFSLRRLACSSVVRPGGAGVVGP